MAAAARKGRMRELVERVASSSAGTFYFRRIANPIDQRLVPATGGRLSMAPGQPVLVLETVGARSGVVRRAPVLYVEDGEDFVLIASNGGAPRNPGWYHNVRARPSDVRVHVRGRSGAYRARIVTTGVEYERLWGRVNDVYSGYERYQARAGSRRIPLVVLTRAS